MTQTKQALAITAAQTVAALMAQLSATHDAVNAFLTANTNNTYDGQWIAFPTITVNADGTLGTPDGTLNNAHPINVPAGNPLLVARNDLLTATGILVNFQNFMNGVAVATQGNTPRKYADLLNK